MLTDALRLIMRVAHTVALAVWLGGGLFYLITRPALSPFVKQEVRAGLDRTMGLLASRSFALLVASGVYLAFDRLSEPRLGIAYVALLAAKLVLVVAIVWIVGARNPSRAPHAEPAAPAAPPRWSDSGWIVLALGAGAALLGVVLTSVYEAELTRP